MAWISSSGGPLLCGSPAAARMWCGMRESSTGESASDFRRACDADALIDAIRCGSTQALLLGGSSRQSTLVTGPCGAAIFRWGECGLSEEELADTFIRLPRWLPTIAPAFCFRLEQLDLMLFDAAASPFTTLARRIEMQPGLFTVSSHRYASGRFDFIVHRLVREERRG